MPRPRSSPHLNDSAFRPFNLSTLQRFNRNSSAACQAGASREGGFTLIELLVVISIIIILMGLLFPAFKGAQDSAKKAQAKNDLTQLVTAVNAYYTEYGKYSVADTDQGVEKTFSGTNRQLIDILRSQPGNDPLSTDPTANKYNIRKIVFFQPPSVKVDTANNRRSGVSATDGNFYDPWGGIYAIRLDSDYNSQVANPYTSNAGTTPIQAGAIAWSLGKDKLGGSGDKKSADADDDVISWQ